MIPCIHLLLWCTEQRVIDMNVDSISFHETSISKGNADQNGTAFGSLQTVSLLMHCFFI